MMVIESSGPVTEAFGGETAQGEEEEEGEGEEDGSEIEEEMVSRFAECSC